MEQYLSRCLDSLLAQNIDSSQYEIIAINDGSKDKSLHILKQYALKYSNIIVINQKNIGLSATRNVGLEIAKGKYIWHIDSDDWIIENCLRELLEICESSNLDMLQVAPSIPVTTNFACDIKNEALSEIYSGKKLLLNEKKVAIGTWAYIVNREFLEANNLKFLSGLLNDDEEFTPRALYYANRVKLMKFSVYLYFQRDGSIVHSFSKQNLYQYLKISSSLKCFAKKNVRENNIRRRFKYISNGIFISGINSIINHNYGDEILRNYLQSAREKKLYPLEIDFFPIKRLILLLMINFFPVLYSRVKRK